MKKITAILSTVALAAWVLPLGAFIKPSQEKTACDGKRAFHMCSAMQAKVRTEAPSGKVSFDNAGGVEKTHKSASSGGGEFATAGAARNASGGSARFVYSEIFLPEQKILFLLDAVPKL